MSATRWRHRAAGAWRLLLWVACGVLAGAATATAQEEGGRRVFDEQLRVRMDQQAPQGREIGIDGGGWFNFAFFHFDDAAARRDRTLRQYQLRGWGSASVQGVHQAYVRALLGYDDWNSGQNPVEWHGDQFTGFEIERAWYRFDLGQLLRNQTGAEPPVDFRVKVGREFAHIGTELVLSMPLDMVQFEAEVSDWELMVLLGKTIHNTRNLDDSPLVSSHQRRCLWGAQLSYKGLANHRPFVYYLDNQDHTRPDPWDPFQGYDYSSRYVGIGSEGSLVLPDLRYQVEAVGEFGKTYSDTATEGSGRDDICAMAVNGVLEYLFQVPTHPKVRAAYLWGSGDGDRGRSATAALAGNRVGTNDNAFNAFGYRDTGLAYAPRISNIHIYSAGAAFFPLETTRAFRQLEVGSNVFFYHKSVASGPVSDVMAIDGARWLGWEWDVYADWRITSDLSWTIRYGAFLPGSAYDDQSCRQFLMTAVVLNF